MHFRSTSSAHRKIFGFKFYCGIGYCLRYACNIWRGFNNGSIEGKIIISDPIFTKIPFFLLVQKRDRLTLPWLILHSLFLIVIAFTVLILIFMSLYQKDTEVYVGLIVFPLCFGKEMLIFVFFMCVENLTV